MTEKTAQENTRDGTLAEFPPGSLLVKENEKSRKMYIIKNGKVRVFKNYMGQRVTLAILGEGEIFGELSFFDAEPRSASVEALTPVQVVVVDGEKANQQIAGLPEWVIPIFKSVFHRFREADQKIMVLQSMNEFQKRTFSHDTVANTIYLELLRFIKTMKILYERDFLARQVVKSDALMQELDDLLGRRYIGLKVFWKLLKEHHFIDHSLEEQQGKVVLNEKELDALNEYLTSEAQKERFLLLSHSSIMVLRRIVGFTQNSNTPVKVKFTDIHLQNLPLVDEALKELAKHKIVEPVGDEFTIDPTVVGKLYTYQSILKAFDHTIMNLN